MKLVFLSQHFPFHEFTAEKLITKDDTSDKEIEKYIINRGYP